MTFELRLICGFFGVMCVCVSLYAAYCGLRILHLAVKGIY